MNHNTHKKNTKSNIFYGAVAFGIFVTIIIAYFGYFFVREQLLLTQGYSKMGKMRYGDAAFAKCDPMGPACGDCSGVVLRDYCYEKPGAYLQ